MNNRTRFALTISALSLALSACNDLGDNAGSNGYGSRGDDTESSAVADARTAPDTTTLPGEPARGSTLAMASDAAMTQPLALHMLRAIDEHEIAAAEQAEQRNLDDDVAEYVRMLKADHIRNLAITRTLLRDTGAQAMPDNADLDAMQIQQGEERQQLATTQSDRAYQDAWLDAMVKGHSETLAKLDKDMIPAASDNKARDHLQQTRTAVARHLEMAQKLRAGTGDADASTEPAKDAATGTNESTQPDAGMNH